MGTVLLVISSIMWGLVHSLLASLRFKAVVRNLFGPSTDRWYRFAYNIFSVVSFLPVLALAALLPDQVLYSVPAPWKYLMWAGQLAALAMLVAGVLQTDTLSFMGISQLMGRQGNSSLVTSGLYRYMRHPLYTAGLLFLWLNPTMRVNQLMLYLILSAYILIGAYFEERKLLREFGEEYHQYMLNTPMLVPVLSRKNF